MFLKQSIAASLHMRSNLPFIIIIPFNAITCVVEEAFLIDPRVSEHRESEQLRQYSD
jgi:hypothetical protein